MIRNWSEMSMNDPLDHLGSIWYHSESSDVPYSPNQFLGWDFFCSFLRQDCSNWHLKRATLPCSVCQMYMVFPTLARNTKLSCMLWHLLQKGIDDSYYLCRNKTLCVFHYTYKLEWETQQTSNSTW